MHTDWQIKTRLLLDQAHLRALQNTHVLIIGLGGVGSWAAEHLVRSGIGNISLVDNDTISESNINRQAIALHSTVNRKKTDVMAERLKDINPDLIVNTYDTFVDEKTLSVLPSFDTFDVVLDCIDTLTPKISVIQTCLENKTPLISSLGSAGKSDPSCVRITDISKSYNCMLGRMLRKRLHKIGIYEGFSVVFSPEAIDKSKVVQENGRNKRSSAGSISIIPALFGTLMAAEVIDRCNPSNKKSVHAGTEFES
ncbi:MAG: tRNA threonylcarbamoyladenosine dehydratase [Bacteroidota bacterium]|nr:tRNA threonylcarbamoyladenosine dehydratase [Bacteroidota bacterium]